MNENDLKNDIERRQKRLNRLNLLLFVFMLVVIAAGFVTAIIVERIYPLMIGAVLVVGLIVLRRSLKKFETRAECCPVCGSKNISIIPASDVVLPLATNTMHIATEDKIGKKYNCGSCGHKW